MFNRNDLKILKDWANKVHHKPLILRGARQVGKTELVRQLSSEFKNFIEINFDELPQKRSLFKSRDIFEVIKLLEVDSGQKIIQGDTLLFFDEIQCAPEILPLLRYFYEKIPNLHVIAAGSLLEFLLAEHDFSMPVGRIEYHFLGPVSFEEFLFAIGENALVDFINNFDLQEKIPEAIHEKCLKYIRYYSVIGGMPKAVAKWIESENFEESIRVHAGILQTFEDDFSKYVKKVNPDHLRVVLKSIPRIIGSKLRYVNISRNIAPSALSSSIRTLSDAQIISRIFHSNANGIPLGAEIFHKVYKPIFLDIGLYSTSVSLRLTDFSEVENYLLINKGALAEQFIGQHLLYYNQSWIKPELFYWRREKKGSSAEVDYLINNGPSIIPVEVKAGKTGSLRSLHTFSAIKNTPLALRFNSDIPSITSVKTDIAEIGTADYKLLSLPLYMVEQTKRIIGTYSSG